MSARRLPMLLWPLTQFAVTHGWVARINPDDEEIRLRLDRNYVVVDVCWQRADHGFHPAYSTVTRPGEPTRDLSAPDMSALLSDDPPQLSIVDAAGRGRPQLSIVGGAG